MDPARGTDPVFVTPTNNYVEVSHKHQNRSEETAGLARTYRVFVTDANNHTENVTRDKLNPDGNSSDSATTSAIQTAQMLNRLINFLLPKLSENLANLNQNEFVNFQNITITENTCSYNDQSGIKFDISMDAACTHLFKSIFGCYFEVDNATDMVKELKNREKNRPRSNINPYNPPRSETVEEERYNTLDSAGKVNYNENKINELNKVFNELNGNLPQNSQKRIPKNLKRPPGGFRYPDFIARQKAHIESLEQDIEDLKKLIEEEKRKKAET